jgi:hypothetical protein
MWSISNTNRDINYSLIYTSYIKLIFYLLIKVIESVFLLDWGKVFVMLNLKKSSYMKISYG